MSKDEWTCKKCGYTKCCCQCANDSASSVMAGSVEKRGGRVVNIALTQKEECCFPYYGMAPHDHDLGKTGSFIGSTVLKDEPQPDNFEPDPEAPGCGTYTLP